ncbi:hypothetical protein D3C78_1110300 [compost metagenome]
MPEKDLVRQRQQLPMSTVCTLDARLFTDAHAPLIGAGRRVAGLARLAFPAKRENIGTPLEKTAEQVELVLGSELHGRWLALPRISVSDLNRWAPLDAMGLQERDEASVFGSQLLESISAAHGSVRTGDKPLEASKYVRRSGFSRLTCLPMQRLRAESSAQNAGLSNSQPALRLRKNCSVQVQLNSNRQIPFPE